jgi:hypothetical protein
MTSNLPGAQPHEHIKTQTHKHTTNRNKIKSQTTIRKHMNKKLAGLG